MRYPRTPAAASIAVLASIWPAWAGDIAIVGTGDGIDMLQAVGAVFLTEVGVAVSVPPSIGSGGAVAAVGGDRHVLGRVARPLTEAEKAKGLQTAPLVRIPTAFFVHPTARVSALTSAQIADIYAGRITNWREVGGADLKIKVVRREDADSTLNVLRASMPGWKDLTITSKSKLAMTTQEAIESVKQVEGSIGFAPFSRLLSQGAVVLKVDGKHPTDRGYPSAVVLSILYKPTTLTSDARAFIRFARSAKAHNVYRAMGGVPVIE
jgi:phosphate transport system substrate-binding protein